MKLAEIKCRVLHTDMILFNVKFFPLVISLFLTLQQHQKNQDCKWSGTNNRGSVLAETDCRDYKDARDAAECEKPEERPTTAEGTSLVKTVISFVLYPLLLLYQCVLLPLLRSSYVSSLWTKEAFLIVFLPYSASFIAIVVCMFYIHVLGGEPLEVRPSHPDGPEDSISDLFSMSWLSFRSPRTNEFSSSEHAHEQKPLTSSTKAPGLFSYPSEMLKITSCLSGEPSETHVANMVSSFQFSDSFDLLLNENFVQRKKQKRRELLLKEKQLKVVSEGGNHALNNWKTWFDNTPLLIRLVFYGALRKRLQSILFVHTNDVRRMTPPTVMQAITSRRLSKKQGSSEQSTHTGENSTVLDFFTFAVLSALILGPRTKSPQMLDKLAEKNARCKYDVTLFVSVMRRTIAESAPVPSALGCKTYDESEFD